MYVKFEEGWYDVELCKPFHAKLLGWHVSTKRWVLLRFDKKADISFGVSFSLIRYWEYLVMRTQYNIHSINGNPYRINQTLRGKKRRISFDSLSPAICGHDFINIDFNSFFLQTTSKMHVRIGELVFKADPQSSYEAFYIPHTPVMFTLVLSMGIKHLWVSVLIWWCLNDRRSYQVIIEIHYDFCFFGLIWS